MSPIRHTLKSWLLRGIMLAAAAAASAASAKATPADAEAFLAAAQRAYATADFAGYTNSLVTAYRPAKEDMADSPAPGGCIRWCRVEGMRNVRDIGGWNGLPTGRVYRGSAPTCRDTPANRKMGLGVTPEGVRTMREVLKIRTDLDLRGPRGIPTPGTSALGVRLVAVALVAYTNAFVSTKGYAEALRVFADPASYPVYVHCLGGADRTGTLMFLLEGLCGVSEADLSIDYELTTFAAVFGRRTRALNRHYAFPQFVARLKEYPGDTLAAKIASCMETTFGLTKDEIAAIRRNILGGS